MGYAPDGRSRFVTADTQAHVYGKIGATGGNALGVVLLNGLAVGAWTSRFKGASMVVALNLFEKPTGRIRQAIEARFHEMAALLKAKKVVLQTG